MSSAALGVLRSLVHSTAQGISVRWDTILQTVFPQVTLPHDCQNEIRRALRGQDKHSIALNSFLGRASGFGRREDVPLQDLSAAAAAAVVAVAAAAAAAPTRAVLMGQPAATAPSAAAAAAAGAAAEPAVILISEYT